MSALTTYNLVLLFTRYQDSGSENDVIAFSEGCKEMYVAQVVLSESVDHSRSQPEGHF